MIPLRDNIPPRTVAVVNYVMIAVCVIVFLIQVAEPEDADSLVERYGMIPARVLNPSKRIVIVEEVEEPTRYGYVTREVEHELAPSAVPPWLTPLTCIFLHGGWLHIIGNMWFLFIFGDNVEDRFGHVGYLVFYVVGGMVASLVHLATNSTSPVPTIGASGAIAAVMGAYLISYPRAMVLALVPIFYFLQIIVLPAPLFLGIWFILQFVSVTTAESTGVAWWAHIGGFAMGVGVTWLLSQTHVLREPVRTIRPHTDHITHYPLRPRHRAW
jgi:hypothetical protein